MFTWICPTCGREVPPTYSECPDCAAKGKNPAPQAAAEPVPPLAAVESSPQEAAPPKVQPAPPPSQPLPPPPGQYAAQAQYPPRPPRPPASALPTWLLTVVFALAFVGLVAGVYWTVGYLKGGTQAAAPPATVESPAAKPGAKANPLQKYVEISGVRFTEDSKKKILVKFILTNHSDADLSGLAGNVTIWGRTQKSEEDAVGTFAFNTNIGPGASSEVTAPLTTKLKIYELPDWQNVTTDLQITAPAAQ